VFPNVVTPLSASLYIGAMDRGQVAAALDWGMVTEKQRAEFRPGEAWLTGVFGGYLYGNVTLARTAVARSPGLTVELVDEQMFGLTGAPAHVPTNGERDPRAAIKTVRRLVRTMQRPSDELLRGDQRDLAAYLKDQPDYRSASVAELVAVARSMSPWTERMMKHLLSTSSAAGISRSLLERIVSPLGEPGLENRLTAGLGGIESAEPARALWDLGRTVRASAELTGLFDGGIDDLDPRLRSSPAASPFLTALAAFTNIYGARGPDEWELASPTWGTEPSLSLAIIERLRHAPDERDPVVVGAALAADRARLVVETRDRLSSWRRPLFDRAARATVFYAAQREATKAAFVRALYPARLALTELGRRSRRTHDDFFLLTIDEVFAELDGAGPSEEEFARRRRRRDLLQAHIPPFWFQGTIPRPDTWGLRVDQQRPDGSGRTITGMGVCAGVATGRARVVMHPHAPGALEPGDILIAPLTDPAWTPLFLAAAGVVVDVGAQQSHAAIVSRELGIPAVVSATGASSTIPDGARVTVDGTRGVVTVHGEALDR
jgi:pyruvate,water dikinase